MRKFFNIFARFFSWNSLLKCVFVSYYSTFFTWFIKRISEQTSPSSWMMVLKIILPGPSKEVSKVVEKVLQFFCAILFMERFTQMCVRVIHRSDVSFILDDGPKDYITRSIKRMKANILRKFFNIFARFFSWNGLIKCVFVLHI